MTTDSSGGKESSGADKYEELRTSKGASFPGVSEFLLRRILLSEKGPGVEMELLLRRVASCVPTAKENQ